MFGAIFTLARFCTLLDSPSTSRWQYWSRTPENESHDASPQHGSIGAAHQRMKTIMPDLSDDLERSS